MDGNEKRVLIVATALMVAFFVGLAYAYDAYGVRIPGCVTDVEPFEHGKVVRRGDKDFEVQMVARMWSFEPQEVVLPPGARVTLYLSSADVVHGMQILGTNVNLMAVPGTVNLAEVTFDREGEYPVICHEYCGRNHQSMSGTFRIAQGAVVTGSEPAAPEAGAGQSALALFDEYACVACHTLDGSSEDVAPSLLGLYGRTRELADGTTVVADEAYLRDAILAPDKQVVKGYDAMPDLGEIPESDVQTMLAALQALGQPGAER